MSFDHTQLGTKLIDALKSNTVIDKLVEAEKPTTLDECYAMQDFVALGVGRKQRGWKVGLGNLAGMKAFGLPSPAAARIYSDVIYVGGSEISFDPFASMVIEFEVIYEVARDVSASEKISNPLDIVSSTHLGFELIQAHIADWKAQGALSFISEGIGFSALVVDPTPTEISHADLLETVSITCDGEHKVGAATGDDGVDPVEMLSFLLGHCQKYGHDLKKGDLISSGTQTVQFVVPISDHHIVAKWNGGSVDFNMTAR